MTRSFDEAIVDPVTYAHPDLCDALFTQLRRDTPVRWTQPAGYRPFWTVSKYSDIMEVEGQNERFINAPRLTLNTIETEERTRAKTGGNAGTSAVRQVINMDGAEHRLYRGLTQAWFMPVNLRKLEDRLAALAKEFVDRMAARGGACDFVKDVGVWFPLRAIMTILGVPREDDRKMLELTQGLLGAHDPEISGGRSPYETRDLAIQEFFRFFGELSAERRRNPTDDLATVIANAQINDEPIATFEQMSYYMIIAAAGHDTTSATVSGGLLALIQNPAELAKLRANPGLIAGAVEEMLRWVTPVKHFVRTATEDYTLRDQHIRAGDGLMMCYPSANRDEEVFEDPFQFRVDRTPNRHLAFGYGAHVCLGMHLAKLELKALYRELLPRLDALELAGEPAWLVANVVSGLKTLPIRYTLRKDAA